MIRLLSAIVAVVAFWPPVSVAQNTLGQTLGGNVAHSLLLRLTNPKRTEYRAGVLNTAAEAGVLISPNGESPFAELIRGYSSAEDSDTFLSWAARDSIDSYENELLLEVKRRRVPAASCPELAGATSQFYAELENAMSSEISLSEMPVERSPGTVQVDGTSYIIQIWTGEREVMIHPDPNLDKPLDDASAELFGVISRCSRDSPGAIEEFRS